MAIPSASRSIERGRTRPILPRRRSSRLARPSPWRRSPRTSRPQLGIDTARVPRNGLPDYDESLFLDAPNPNPTGSMAAPGPKRIEVDISEQRLWAYQGDVLITSTLVSTGIPPNTTEEGRFRVRYKFPSEDMKGFLGATGEVVGLDDGTTTAPAPGAVDQPTTSPTYPTSCISTSMPKRLHGAYWHNNFGQQMSHGCINLPLDMAAFLYDWAPLGTEVIVHE